MRFVRSLGVALLLMTLAPTTAHAAKTDLGYIGALHRPVFDGSYGLSFYDSIIAFDDVVLRRPMLEEFVRLRLQGPIEDWRFGVLSVSGEFRNADIFGRGEPNGLTTLGVRSRASLFPTSYIPVRAWGGLQWQGARGAEYAYGRALQIDGGSRVELNIHPKAPNLSVSGWVLNRQRGDDLDDPTINDVLTNLEVTAVQNAGPLNITGAYRRNSIFDALAEQTSVSDSWSASGSLRAHRTLQLSGSASASRYRDWDNQNRFADLQSEDARADVRWRPSPRILSTTFYRYRRNRFPGYRSTHNTVGSDASILLARGLTVGGNFQSDVIEFAEDEGDRTSISERVGARFEAYRRGRHLAGRAVGSVGGGYSKPKVGDAGPIGTAALRVEGSVLPVRQLSIHSQVGWQRVEDRSARNLEMDRVLAGLSLQASAGAGLNFTGRYALNLLIQRQGVPNSTSHDIDLRGSANPTRWLHFSGNFQQRWQSQGEVLNAQTSLAGEGAFRLNELLLVNGVLRYDRFVYSGQDPRSSFEGTIGATLSIRRWAVTGRVRSRFSALPTQKSEHAIMVTVGRSFVLYP